MYKTRWRRVGGAAFLAAMVAGAVVGAVAALGGTAPRADGLTSHMHLGNVIGQVRHRFGDRRILSASIAGSTLTVKLDVTRRSDQAAQMKGVFEAQVLGHAVADWMRLQRQEPIAVVSYRDRQGKTLLGYGDDTLESDPNVGQLSSAACMSAARPAAKGLLTLASARTLPYLHGTCVFVFRTSKPHAGSQMAAGALLKMINAIGPPNLRPWFFELLTRKAVPLSSASWMPDAGGATWAKPGYAYALAHN